MESSLSVQENMPNSE